MKWRGPLCRRCNLGLGFFEDNISIMRAAIRYVIKYRKINSQKPGIFPSVRTLYLGRRERRAVGDRPRRKYQTRRGEMAFKCGHCGKKHDTAAEGLKCFNDKVEARKQAKGDDSPPTPDFIKQEVDAQTEHMRPGAQKFLSDLLRQFGIKLAGGMTPETIPWQDGKKVLQGLIDARRLKATSQEWTLPDGIVFDPKGKTSPSSVKRPTQNRLPDCEPGYYAVPDWTGKEELKFFWVKVKKGTGPYAGWTFVDQVIGGHPNLPCHGKFAVDAINAILEFGPENAGILFATKLKCCYKCSRHLTKKASRVLSLGRHCAYLKGKGEDWDALNATYGDADADD